MDDNKTHSIVAVTVGNPLVLFEAHNQTALEICPKTLPII
jgi:hypothetical protein